MSSLQPRVVLAALDATTAARAALEAARRFAKLTAADVRAVHVGQDEPGTLGILAQRAGLRLRLLSGSVEDAVLDQMADPDVIAAVIGARGIPTGPRPAGHTAQQLLTRASKPIVVVAPETLASGPVRRLLIPLEGDEVSSEPIMEALLPLLAVDVELIVLHVFTPTTMPRMLDRPRRDMELLGNEFIATHCPPATRIVLRSDPVAASVAEVSKECSVDLVVLSWSQHSSPTRARVVREVIGASTVPVLLLPVRHPGPSPEDTTDGGGTEPTYA